MATHDGIQVLDSGVGYGVVIGIGAFFALLMLALTWLQNRYTAYSTKQAEEFNTASRSVKPGLIAAGIVSSWTWSSTLLTSSTFAYSYGICGPMWYGAMGTSQILLFSLIAIKIKSNAPGAHTMPEIILSRHGKPAHLTYLFFGLATNMLVGACLVLGGAQVTAGLSGVNVYGTIFLIPLVVAAYVIAGGLRSTFIADYAHTVILFAAIFVFCFEMYVPSLSSAGSIAGRLSGGIDGFYRALQEAGETNPVPGNHGGSYLTFKSNDGLVFAVDLLVAGFANVWLDQAYWQRAIASRPETSVRAYLFGGVAWYGIPFAFGTAMGLGCVALTGTGSFPTFPDPLTAAQNGAGLSAPASAVALLGRGGAGLMLLLLFMAVTSSTSAELIAVSSLITFDVYKTYLKPAASSTEFCCILNAVNINLTWVLTILGVLVGGASIPVGLVLLWPRMSTVATLAAPWVGLAFGMLAWLLTTRYRSGRITVETSGDVLNALAGNLVSAGTGTVLAVVLSFVYPGQHAASDSDPEARRRMHKINGMRPPPRTSTDGVSDSPQVAGEKSRDGRGDAETPDPATPPHDVTSDPPQPDTLAPTGNAIVDFLEASYIEPMAADEVRKATRLAQGFNLVYWLLVIFLVPFTLFGTQWEFTLAGFRGWCVVSFIWVWCSMGICVIWPLVESRGTMASIARGLFRDVRSSGGERGRSGQSTV
ncbi:hypothetical protein PG991_010722 [Apiospora marii]|uniref:Urea active transporter n=1 Tax=Apiospora marii TaxID=335849 RepID=A0ABR1RC43_9PEZI